MGSGCESPPQGGIVSKIETPSEINDFRGGWSEWGDSNARSPDPKLIENTFFACL